MIELPLDSRRDDLADLLAFVGRGAEVALTEGGQIRGVIVEASRYQSMIDTIQTLSDPEVMADLAEADASDVSFSAQEVHEQLFGGRLLPVTLPESQPALEAIAPTSTEGLRQTIIQTLRNTVNDDTRTRLWRRSSATPMRNISTFGNSYYREIFERTKDTADQLAEILHYLGSVPQWDREWFYGAVQAAGVEPSPANLVLALEFITAQRSFRVDPRVLAEIIDLVGTDLANQGAEGDLLARLLWALNDLERSDELFRNYGLPRWAERVTRSRSKFMRPPPADRMLPGSGE